MTSSSPDQIPPKWTLLAAILTACAAIGCSLPTRTSTNDLLCLAFESKDVLLEPTHARWFLYIKGVPLAEFVTEGDALRASHIAKLHSNYCRFGGRGGLQPAPWLTARRGSSDNADDEQEDCLAYDPTIARISMRSPSTWEIVAGRHLLTVLEAPEETARRALDVVREHHSMCFVGRGQPRESEKRQILVYWK